MAFQLLYNTSANQASSITATSLTLTAATGFNTYDIIAGPRSKMLRTTASSSAAGVGYEYTSSTSIEYIWIARADLFLTLGTSRVTARQRASGGTWSYGAVDYNPLTSASLIGPRSQDLLAAVSHTDLYGLGVAVAPLGGTTQAMQLSKLGGMASFAFGVEPEVYANWAPIAENTFITPINGTMPYEIEKKFSLRFPFITRAKAIGFRDVPQVFRWPILLYDSTGDIWSHKLEHVLVESYSEEIHRNDVHTLTINFARLKHYD